MVPGPWVIVETPTRHHPRRRGRPIPRRLLLGWSERARIRQRLRAHICARVTRQGRPPKATPTPREGLDAGFTVRSARRELLAGNSQGPQWLRCGLLYGGIRQPSLFITGVDQRAMEAPHPIDLASPTMGCGDGQEAQKFFYAEQ
jgi:hypothetical protein